MDEPRPGQDQPESSQDDTQQLFPFGAPTPPPPPPGGYGYGYGAPYQGFGQQGEYPPYGQQQGPQQGHAYGPYAYGPYAAYPPPQEKRRSRGPVVAAVGTALAVVLAAGVGGFALGRTHQSSPSAGGPGGGYGLSPRQSPEGGLGNLNPFSGNGQQVSPFSSGSGPKAQSTQLSGLVRVATTLKYQGGMAAGTGMILTSDGEVITNHHVVAGATNVKVTVMSTGRTYTAQVVGTDAHDDVAVLQLNGATGLATVTTNTNGVSVGDTVTAVGDAGGSPSTFSAAKGKVTATDQNITTRETDGSLGEKLSGLMEISSDVISGDSGGATYDAQGQVVGMTTAASTGSTNVVGYAIPISTVLQVADDLENHVLNARYAYGAPAFLGLGLSGQGTTVEGVYPGTPAARAGVNAGATITRVGGTTVNTAAGLKKAVQAYSPGDQVQLTWTDQQGASHTATVTLIKGPIA